MESISISTVNDFEGSPSSRLKRKKLSSIACDPCRKLKIRCQNGVPSSETADSESKPCSHCRKVERACVWPSDRRKRLRSSAEDARGPNPVLFGNHGQGKETPSGTRNYDESRYDVQQRTALQDPSSTSHHPLNAWTQGPFQDTVPQPETDSGSYEDVTEASNDALSTPLADTPREQLAYTTVQYARHLGATAIAPGHKKISLKVKRSRAGLTEDNFASSSSQPKDGRIQFDQITDGPLSVFDTTTGLPCEKLLPHLLDSFFENYNDNFCFLNRAYLEQLIECGGASEFLICTVSALSARFCPQEVFDKYLHPKANGGKRESWELCLPFLERAKELLMPLLNIPSCDVIAGLLLLSWADFGDNNEAGMLNIADHSGTSTKRTTR